MRKIENFTAIAQKLSSGTLEYCLWVDDEGALFVQLVGNLTNTENPGRYSSLLFKVSTYFDLRYSDVDLENMPGVDPSNFAVKIDGNTNTGGFIKAILRHLFPQ